VENLTQLLEAYISDSRLEEWIDHIKQHPGERVHLQNLVGAQEAFVLTALSRKTKSSVCLVCNDKESAAYAYSSIRGIMGESRTLFFPDSFRRPRQYEEIDQNNVLTRTEAINKASLTADQAFFMVTYPEALFERVVSGKELQKSRIDVHVGEDLDVDTTIEVLTQFGFVRTDFVYEPGQFSIRGEIIDIFSFGNEWPYRIELFDEEVESIRIFNPLDQLSIQKISRVSLVPDINQRFSAEDKVPVFDLFDENVQIVIQDLDHLLDTLMICFEKVSEFLKYLKTDEKADLIELLSERAFVYPNEVMDFIGKRSYAVRTRPQDKAMAPGYTVDFDGKPQPSFNRNFALLIQHMKEQQENGVTPYLFATNAKQLERFYSIFKDLDADVHFLPVLDDIHEGFMDDHVKVACYTDHQIFERFHRYNLKRGFSRQQALNLRMLRELQPGDFVTHIDHGVGKYSGLEKIDINGHIQESVRLLYKNNDILYVSINSLHKISKFVGKDGKQPVLNKLGSDTWKKLKAKTKKKVKDIAKELIKLYAQRKATVGHAFPPDGYLQHELEASFIYEDTPDQYKATQEVKSDMENQNPMDRLICGDVGFGKTEVAIRAAFKAVCDGKQVAVLVPTTILALQHHKTFTSRLEDFPVTVDYVNRFRTTAEKNELYKNLKEGKVDIVIGTHAILNKKVEFKDLGLLIIDEEQKFGVAAKEKLRRFKVNVDTLTLTATPIPRTLQFSLMAARDMSIIRTPPPNRQPIHTERRVFSEDVVKESIYYEIHRGGQVFFVHNRVASLGEMAAMLQRMCPDVRFSIAHGQMEAKKLEAALMAFIKGETDVLVCTNIIETGLDIPNANTIIINNAHHYGLSDLHQLRGRVGRSNTKAYCYLFTPPLSVLSTDARKRLRTVEEFSDLGGGFEIAMRDLDIRGAGNLLGGEQSGFISDIGYDTYQKILEEAIMELKETEFKEVFKEELEKERDYVRDVVVETDVEMLIPDSYVSNIQERLNLYTELDNINDIEELEAYKRKLKDRFGPIPKQVHELFEGLILRWVSRRLGFERVSIKKGKLRCYFIANAQSMFFESVLFKNILAWMGTGGADKGYTLKQSSNYLILIKEDVYSLSQAERLLSEIYQEVKTI
jgi:transcription-repair coupling factor (superfamily II helicase)